MLRIQKPLQKDTKWIWTEKHQLWKYQRSIRNLSKNTNYTKLKSFLESIHHLKKFIPNLATLCWELKNLFQKDTKWIWTEKQKLWKYQRSIWKLTENTNYDKKQKTRIKRDASRAGLRAVLEQETCNDWQTISYALRFLNKAEETNSIKELEQSKHINHKQHKE